VAKPHERDPAFRQFVHQHQEWLKYNKKRLTRIQRQVLDDLEDDFQGLWEYAGLSLHKIDRKDGSKRHEFIELCDRMDGLIMKAARLGLKDHPWVKERIRTYRGRGERNLLRRAKQGLEKGVRRPNSQEEMEMFSEIYRLSRERRLSLRSIYKNLHEKRTAPYRGSWQAFQKWCERHNVQELLRKGRRPLKVGVKPST